MSLEPTSIQLDLPHIQMNKDDKLQAALILAKKMEELHDKAGQLAAQLEQVTEEGKHIEEVLLPDLMMELGLKDFTLSSGRKLVMKTDYYANVSKDRFAEARKWLEAHRMDAIIKTDLLVDKLHTSQLDTLCIPYQVKEGIHPSTLKALVKEQCELPNSTFPKELFGVHQVTRAIVKE